MSMPGQRRAVGRVNTLQDTGVLWVLEEDYVGLCPAGADPRRASSLSLELWDVYRTYTGEVEWG